MKARHLKTCQAVAMAAMSVAGLVETAYGVDTTFSWVGPSAAGGNVSWSLGANWAGGVAPPQTPAAGDNTIFAYGGNYSVGTSTQNAVGSATNVADYTINKFIFNDYTNAAGTSTTGSLVLNTTGSGSRAIYLGSGGILMNTTAASTAGGSVSIQTSGTPTESRLFLTADQTWTVNNTTANLTIKRPIEGAFTIIKDGLGTLQLSAPASNAILVNGSAGTVNANGSFNGTLDIRQGGVRLDTGSLEFASPNAHLVVNTNNDIVFAASSTFDQTINGQVFLGGTGNFGLSGSNSISFNNSVTLLSDKSISIGTPRVATFSGPIGGSFGIIKGGAGTFVFSGTNSYSGATTINSGFLAIDNPANNLGTGSAAVVLGNAGGSVGTVGALVVRTSDQTLDRGLTINSGGGSVDFSGGLTINGPIAGSTGSTGGLIKAGAGVLTTTSIRIGGPLTALTGSLVTKADGSDAASNHVSSLVLGGTTGAWTSKLDLNNNSLVIDYAAGASPLTTVADQLKSGYASGSWTGQGIASGSAAAIAIDPTIHKTALGYAEASALGVTSFAGQTVDGDAVLIRYTYQGDANLDGKVNALDFNALANGYGTSAPWSSGDFNYDGTVNTSDFTALSQNFGRNIAPAPALGSVVPEPVTVSLLSMALGVACTRRRRALHAISL